ncbi:MAG: hypothetical protein ACI4WR_09935, partial [Bulleidia sp.]
MKILWRIIRWILQVLLIVVLVNAAVMIYNAKKQLVSRNYQKTAAAGGPIEAKYLQNGSHAVSYADFDAADPIRKYEIYYPDDLESSDETYPLIVYCNGSGVNGSRMKALFRHWASWGFVVIDGEDPMTATGDTTD